MNMSLFVKLVYELRSTRIVKFIEILFHENEG